MAWEVVQAPDLFGDLGFHLLVNAYYDDGDYPAHGDHYAYLYPAYTAPQLRWASTMINRSGGTGSHYWNCYYNGTLVEDDFWWPYDEDNFIKTSVEAFDYVYGSGDALGHFDDVNLRAANGTWYLFSSSWDARHNVAPAYIVQTNPHYEWYGWRTAQ